MVSRHNIYIYIIPPSQLSTSQSSHILLHVPSEISSPGSCSVKCPSEFRDHLRVSDFGVMGEVLDFILEETNKHVLSYIIIIIIIIALLKLWTFTGAMC